jgi:hypothetical protein
MCGGSLGDYPSELNRDGVAKLSHGFGPGAMEYVAVGKGLKAGAFADGEVTDGAV